MWIGPLDAILDFVVNLTICTLVWPSFRLACKEPSRQAGKINKLNINLVKFHQVVRKLPKNNYFNYGYN